MAWKGSRHLCLSHRMTYHVLCIILLFHLGCCLQGFNATLTEAVDTPGRRGGHQIKEMEPKLHPDLKEPLTALCSDPKTTVVVLSGSGRNVLDDVSHLVLFLSSFLCLVFPILK